MESRSVVGGNEYVHELLEKDNYEDWSLQMRTYLTAMNLWEVVEEDDPIHTAESDIQAWHGANAAALHLIQISCGHDAFAMIRDKKLAKKAWDTLADNFASKDNEALEAASQEEDEDDANFLLYKPFFDAVRSGDWDAASDFLTEHPEAVRQKLSSTGKTALHVAVSAGNLRVVERLVQLMSAEDLEMKRKADGFTALAIATEKGNIKMAKRMVEKNPKLLAITDLSGSIPVRQAVEVGQKSIALYLYSQTPLEVLLSENSSQGIELLYQSINMDNFDIALDLFKQCRNLIFNKNKSGNYPAYVLALKPYGFYGRNRLRIWQRWIYNCLLVHPHDIGNDIYINVQSSSEDKQSHLWSFKNLVLNPLGRMASVISSLLGITELYKVKLAHVQASELLKLMCAEITNFNVKQIREAGIQEAVFRAARKGFVEFIVSVSQANHDLVWTPQLWKRMFNTAIHHRRARVFSLIYGLDSKHEITSYFDEFGNTVWHTAGELAPDKQLNLIPGAALQMQREMQWFKAVGETLTEAARNLLNNDQKTAREIFTQHHRVLLAAGEKWMKETSTSCSLVGALIITIMFTAAFTVPGGNHQEGRRKQAGYPIFLNEKLFRVFILSDAVSFFSATTSVLVFLGILTSRYAEEDFLRSLPTKMIIGLSTLFFSIAAMMIAFCSALSIMFRNEQWIVPPLVLLAGVPIGLFVWMQFPLLVEIFKSTYGPSIFDRNMKNWVYAAKSAH